MSSWHDFARLHHGPFEETLKTCADIGGVDLVFTSPPYCDARTYGAAVSWTDADYQRLGDHVFAALKPGGHALINVDAPVRKWRKGYGTERGFHPWRLMLDWAERVGFRVPDRLAFARQAVPGAFPKRFKNEWEPLIWFQRPGEDVDFFDSETIGRKVTKSYKTQSTRKSSRNRKGESRRESTTGRRRSQAAESGMVARGTLWEYGNVGAPSGGGGAPDLVQANHSARWPYRLAADIVKCFCPPGGIACDPFTGCGTSLLAALDNGCRFVGGDLFCRQIDETRPDLDGAPWVEIAARLADARYAQMTIEPRWAGLEPLEEISE